MRQMIFQVDAFTSQPFAGNPAGVCILQKPADEAKAEQSVEPPADLGAALGVKPRYVGKNAFDYLVEVDDEAAVRAAEPDFTRLGKLPVRGVIVTSRSAAPEFDFVSRFFAPAAGVNEDPVTGSAHCCLAPYWAAKLGKIEMTAFQASARGGVVGVRLVGDRVILRGQAVTVLKCELLS